MLQKRTRLVVRGQEAHHVRPEVRIAGTGMIDVLVARGGLLQQRLVEDCPQAPVPILRLAHRADSRLPACPRQRRTCGKIAHALELLTKPPSLHGSPTCSSSGDTATRRPTPRCCRSSMPSCGAW